MFWAALKIGSLRSNGGEFRQVDAAHTGQVGCKRAWGRFSMAGATGEPDPKGHSLQAMQKPGLYPENGQLPVT